MGTAMVIWENPSPSPLPVNPDGSVEFTPPDKWEAARYRRAIDVAKHKDSERARIIEGRFGKKLSKPARDTLPVLVVDDCCAVETYVPTLDSDGNSRTRPVYSVFDDWDSSEDILSRMRELEGELNFHDERE